MMREVTVSVMDKSKRAKYKCPMELLSGYVDYAPNLHDQFRYVPEAIEFLVYI